MPAVHRIVLIALPLALAACSYADDRDNAQNNSAVALNGTDPALAAALQDQIMVEPGLAQQANGDAVRPPAQPYSAPLPAEEVATNNAPAPTQGVTPAPAATPCANCDASQEAATLGALAARQKDGRTSGCAERLDYSAAWATRLPADLPLHPQARVTEAAGAVRGGCSLRVVSFSAPLPAQALIDWYYSRVTKAGYDAQHQVDGQAHVLGGTRSRDGGAYVLYFYARAGGGTDVDLLVNNGT